MTPTRIAGGIAATTSHHETYRLALSDGRTAYVLVVKTADADLDPRYPMPPTTSAFVADDRGRPVRPLLVRLGDVPADVILDLVADDLDLIMTIGEVAR